MSKISISLSGLLKHLAKATERLSESEIADVINGKRRLIVSTVESVSDQTSSEDTQPNFDDLITRLRSAESRDFAQMLIGDARLTRVQLVQVAKALDLPIQSNDDLSRLREKIIETTVGFRLRSSAIHDSRGSNNG